MSSLFQIKWEAWCLLFELYGMLMDIPEITIEGGISLERGSNPRDKGNPGKIRKEGKRNPRKPEE